MDNEIDRTVALAGIYQAAEITQSLARTGHYREESMTVMVASLLALNSSNTQSIYGGVAGVVPGLKVIHNRMVSQADIADFELGRYVFSLMQLANRLSQNAEMAGLIQTRITELHVAGVTDDIVKRSGVPDGELKIDGAPDVFAFLASIYSDTISNLVPQIIVHGEHGYLADEKIVNRVRTSLLSGVRSAYLWTQLGGRKWHMLYQKRQYIDRSAKLLADIGVNPVTRNH